MCHNERAVQHVGPIRDMNVTKERSPFTPGRPVSVEDFIGRSHEFNLLDRALKQASTKGNENIFLTGERGIGKSSLADVLSKVAASRDKFISAHCYLGPARDLDEACRIIVQQLIHENATSETLDKFRDVFGQYIRSLQIGLLGVGVQIELNDPDRFRDLRLNFIPTLQALLARVADSRKGVLLILDDINGLSSAPELALFLKSTVDSFTSLSKSFPFLLVLVGIEDRMADLTKSQPSIARIFDVVNLVPLSQEESREFFVKKFQSVGTEVEDGALLTLTRYSGGLPVLMHEVGDAVYWQDDNNRVDHKDAVAGIITASENVGRKYLKREVYQAIRSDVYHSILDRISKLPLDAPIRRKELLREATEAEKRNFDNFIRRMRDLGVLIPHPEHGGEYVFSNDLLRVYFWWQTFLTQKMVDKS